MSVTIRLVARLGQCSEEQAIPAPANWGRMDDDDREIYLQDLLSEFVLDAVESRAEVEDYGEAA